MPSSTDPALGRSKRALCVAFVVSGILVLGCDGGDAVLPVPESEFASELARAYCADKTKCAGCEVNIWRRVTVAAVAYPHSFYDPVAGATAVERARDIRNGYSATADLLVALDLVYRGPGGECTTSWDCDGRKRCSGHCGFGCSPEERGLHCHEEASLTSSYTRSVPIFEQGYCDH